MASVKIVTKANGTVLRNVKMGNSSTEKVDQVASTLDSIICEDKDVLKVVVDYEGCDDSQTI